MNVENTVLNLKSSEGRSMKNDGGAAFPRVLHIPEEGTEVFEGMSLRDYFAAKAMQAFITSGSVKLENHKTWEEATATEAYKFADAMLAEAERSE